MGAYEYLLALKGFDAFLSVASSEEFAALDELVAERDEFVVYRNLFRAVAETPPPLAARVDTSSDLAREHEGRGLQWVVALARVELAAMMALFGSNKDPFAQFGPGQVEANAWFDLMADGASVHFAALEADPWFQDLNRAPLDNNFFTQQKHLLLTGQMLTAVARSMPSDAPVNTRKRIEDALKKVEQTAKVMNARLGQR